ncbi:cell envelope biogenesis protein OmpA [Rhizobium sp. RU36D]|uniref:cell envelope biogenesis protein OmpA n=1 Tax=Rhizobium sp. RU36D TaxID=1907415 RepID=UPI0009D7D4C5|nr:cell envelope biogenesis protein OmpA [Rhizobium sp. RU36D]SMC62087.1 hypothetical protein SAMN05880593_103283 [Rhizobium sp. RU36D]
MFETAFTLSLTQFARSLSMPERIQRRTGRNAALEAFRLRNAGLDAMFYDVKALTPEEVFYLSDSIAAEGLIMIVPPSGGAMLTVCDSIDEYLLRGGRDVHIMALAGIGGSALGAAAFARNVADAMGAPVAAVVSGYGLGDLVNEAIGGAFLFGWLGNFRNQCEVIDDVVGRPRLGAYSDNRADANKPHTVCLDVDTVKALLSDESLSFHMLAGHSKGNLVLSEALYAMRRTNRERVKALGAAARIVTFGARITMPPEFPDVIDVMGDLDWYGEMNSRPKIDSDIRIPMAGHSTNSDLVGSLPVVSILREITAKALPVPGPIGHEIMALPEPALPVVEPVAEPLPVPTPEPVATVIPEASLVQADAEPIAAELIEPAPQELQALEEIAPPPSPVAEAKPPARRARAKARK